MSFWSGKKVGVPGGAGCIGSYLVEDLVASGAQVVVLDDLSHGKEEHLCAVADAIRFERGDASDLPLVERVFSGCDILLNLAGQAPGIQLDPGCHAQLMERNLALGSTILEAGRRLKVERQLVVSSSCVYPDDAPVPTPELPLCTGEPERINSGYGWAKRYLELLAMHYATAHGQRVAIARPFNAYSPRDLYAGPGAHVLPALIAKLTGPDPTLTVWGSGNQTRSFIHARDVSKGLALLTEHHAVADPVNIGHSIETRLRDLVAMLMETSGITKEVVFDTTKPEGALRKSSDTTKMQQVLNGWLPETELRTGLAEIFSQQPVLE